MISAVLLLVAPLQSPEWSLPPIEYGKAAPTDAVTKLVQGIESGDVVIPHDGAAFSLEGLLDALGVPTSSQVTVFSRTSMQAKAITPQRPRALYFSDDVYVGYVPDGNLLEITTVDEREGLVFYSLDRRAPTAESQPQFRRETHRCLQCHATTRSAGMPAHVLRSVHADRRGEPEFGLGSVFMDPSTPYEKRWGGWFVTGNVGAMAHIGNQFSAGSRSAIEPSEKPHGNLDDLCQSEHYPTNTSDVVALLVLEHQTHAQNAIVQASFEARKALDYQRVLNEMLGEPLDTPVHSTDSRLDRAAEKVIAALMHSEEVPLPGPIGQDSPFVAAFMGSARRDSRGRSLRDMDLESRLFRYPLSYTVDSPAFRGLPEPLAKRVWAGLHLALQAEPHFKETLEILKETRAAEIPAEW